MTTRYEPTAADRAAYGRLMLVHPELRQECSCYGAALGKVCGQCYLIWPDNACYDDCILCHGTGYVAPPPETWCGLLVRVAHEQKLVVTLSPADPSLPAFECQLVDLHVWLRWGGGNYPVPSEHLKVGMSETSIQGALLAALEQAAAAP